MVERSLFLSPRGSGLDGRLKALCLGLALLLVQLPGHAAEDFVPVTDEMLQNPADGGLADVSPHAR